MFYHKIYNCCCGGNSCLLFAYFFCFDDKVSDDKGVQMVLRERKGSKLDGS